MNPAILIPVLCIVILMLCDVPVWIAMFAGVMPYFIGLNPFGFAAGTVIQRLVATMETTSYLAIPYFVTAGAIMNYSGISKRLLDFADALIGHLTGGLGHVNVLLSVFMGGISGSAAADAAMECKMLVPEMERKGYSKEFSAAVTLASSLITPIIPPGMGLIVYAMLAEVSVGRMFAAGYLPGFLTAILMMVLVYVISKKHGYKGSREKMAPAREILKLALDGFWALIIPFGLLMALRSGVFSANEAGAFCSVYALIIGAFVYKELKPKHLWPILKESFLGTATVMMTICGAMAMSYWLNVERIPNMLAQVIVQSGLSSTGFILLVVVMLLIFGMFMTSGITILAPLLVPIASALHIDLIHFGLVMVFTLGIGNMSPPFGIVLYQVSSLLEIKLEKLIKASFPFLVLMILCALLYALVPWFSTFLPTVLYG
ncbi:MAG: TRAP transporter large permease [Faecousia sp.]